MIKPFSGSVDARFRTLEVIKLYAGSVDTRYCTLEVIKLYPGSVDTRCCTLEMIKLYPGSVDARVSPTGFLEPVSLVLGAVRPLAARQVHQRQLTHTDLVVLLTHDKYTYMCGQQHSVGTKKQTNMRNATTALPTL